MSRAWLLAGLILSTATRLSLAAEGSAKHPASTYLLGCGGCHGITGISNSKLVPDLHEQVGYFLNTVEGRNYLVRVPNVAFYTASDQELTDMLNYMVFELGGSSVPRGAKHYTLSEVSALRKQPLTEVSLTAYRSRLVDELIARHHAPDRLRVYGSDGYRPIVSP